MHCFSKYCFLFNQSVHNTRYDDNDPIWRLNDEDRNLLAKIRREFDKFRLPHTEKDRSVWDRRLFTRNYTDMIPHWDLESVASVKKHMLTVLSWIDGFMMRSRVDLLPGDDMRALWVDLGRMSTRIHWAHATFDVMEWSDYIDSMRTT